MYFCIDKRIEFKFVKSPMPFTAFDETGIIGFFTLRNPNGAANELRVGFVTIKLDKRGKGYGKAILRLGLKFVFEFMRLVCGMPFLVVNGEWKWYNQMNKSGFDGGQGIELNI